MYTCACSGWLSLIGVMGLPFISRMKSLVMDINVSLIEVARSVLSFKAFRSLNVSLSIKTVPLVSSGTFSPPVRLYDTRVVLSRTVICVGSIVLASIVSLNVRVRISSERSSSKDTRDGLVSSGVNTLTCKGDSIPMTVLFEVSLIAYWLN